MEASALRWMAVSWSMATVGSVPDTSPGSSDSTSPSSRESTISESFSVSMGSSGTTTLCVSGASCGNSDAFCSGICSRARFNTTPSFTSSPEGELLEADGGRSICGGKELVLSLVVVNLVLCPRRGPPRVVLILALAPAFQVVMDIWHGGETGEPRSFLVATIESGSSKSSGPLLRSKATVRESGSSAIAGVAIGITA